MNRLRAAAWWLRLRVAARLGRRTDRGQYPNHGEAETR